MLGNLLLGFASAEFSVAGYAPALSARVSPPLLGSDMINFVHVPKTGGTSLLREVFPRVCRERKVCLRRYVSTKMIDGMDCDETEGYVVVAHMGLDLEWASSLVPGTPRIFVMTFVREPIDRFISFANFRYVELDDFESGSWRQMGGIAGMTHMIAGSTGVNDSACVDYVDRALYNVEFLYSFVGITNRYDESTFLLAHTFGWPEEWVKPAALCPSRHFKSHFIKAKVGFTGWKREQLAQTVIDEIRAAVAGCDRRVYDKAVELLDARLAKLPDKADLHRFVSEAQAANRRQEKNCTTPPRRY